MAEVPTIYMSVGRSLNDAYFAGLNPQLNYDDNDLYYVVDERRVTLTGSVFGCEVTAHMERGEQSVPYIKTLLDEAFYKGFKKALRDGPWHQLNEFRCGLPADGSFCCTGIRGIAPDGIIPAKMVHACGGLPEDDESEQCISKARKQLQSKGYKALLVMQRDYVTKDLRNMCPFTETSWVVSNNDIMPFMDAMMFIILPDLSTRVHHRRREVKVAAASAELEQYLKTIPDPTVAEAKLYFKAREAKQFPIIMPNGDPLQLPPGNKPLSVAQQRPRVLRRLPTGQHLILVVYPSCSFSEEEQHHVQTILWDRSRMTNDCLGSVATTQRVWHEASAQYKKEFAALSTLRSLYSHCNGAGTMGRGYGSYEEVWLDNDFVWALPQVGTPVTPDLADRYNKFIRDKCQAVLDRQAAAKDDFAEKVKKREDLEKMEKRLAEELRKLQILDSRQRAEEQAAKELGIRLQAAQPQAPQSSSKKKAVAERHSRRAKEQYDKLAATAWVADQSEAYKQGLARGRLEQELEQKRKLVATMRSVMAAKRKELGAEQEAREHKVPAPPTIGDWFEGLE